jgi:hypothetical protein
MDLSGTFSIKAVIFQEGDVVCAQCLDYDIATHAESLEALRRELGRIIVAHLVACLENGVPPFTNLPRGPQKYWDMFNESRIILPPSSERLSYRIGSLTIEVGAPELRIAVAA